MAIHLEEFLSQMPLTTVSELGSHELQRFRSKASSEERYCVEIVRRALVDQTDEALSALQECFSETIRLWLRSHPSRDVALLRNSEENYLAQTFSRFWYAVRDHHLEFSTLPAAFRYLHATLSSLITDTLRSHLRLRSREAPLPEPALADEPYAEGPLESEDLWESIQLLILNERERCIFYLLYCCGLKPREVVIRCSQEFDDVKEIYRLNTIIIERLRRNRERLAHNHHL